MEDTTDNPTPVIEELLVMDDLLPVDEPAAKDRENYTPSPTVGNRSDLALLCNTKGLLANAVEVGTDRGLFAAEFLAKWNGEMLFCVDPYSEYSEMPWDRECDFLFAVHALAQEARRVRFLRADSKTAARWFNTIVGLPRQLDFVYIDGAHDYESVLMDIRNWWPLVRPGGILAGDDFGSSEHEGVRKAVVEFFEPDGLRVDLTTDYNRAPSWYVEKP